MSAELRLHVQVDTLLEQQMQIVQSHMRAFLEEQEKPMTWSREYKDGVQALSDLRSTAAADHCGNGCGSPTASNALQKLPFPAFLVKVSS